ncbi:MAG: DHH family phosphoesterase [Bacteroidales bacterium]
MNQPNADQRERLFKILAGYRNPVVLTHFDPDGDAVGSALGMALYLEKKLRTNVPVLIPNETPSFLRWLPGFERVINFSDNPAGVTNAIQEADCFFLVDFNALSRLKKMGEHFTPNGRPVVLIDHHPDPSVDCDLVISDVRVSSTSELIYELIGSLNDLELIDTDIAVNLFTGIMTDTGCFSFNSSRPRTFQTVAGLLSSSFDKNDIFSKIYDNYSESRMRLMGYCLHEKMVVLPRHKTAYIALSREELSRFKFQPGDSEGFVNLPFSIQGVRFTALFIERDDHIKISFRSRGSFPANKFSEAHFSGGGHLNAAGGESHQDLQTTVDRFLETLTRYTIE